MATKRQQQRELAEAVRHAVELLGEEIEAANKSGLTVNVEMWNGDGGAVVVHGVGGELDLKVFVTEGLV